MSPEAVDRRLAAILSADVVGYSRLMAEDERETLRGLKACQEVAARVVREHRGRVVDSPGDNLLAEFPSALDAVEAALEMQREIAEGNGGLPAERRMQYRIGVHLGDVVVDGERIYGDGVNIAARLQALSDPGGICVSGAVHEQVGKKLGVSYRDLGMQSLRNLPEPVHAYSIRADGLAASPKARPRVVRSPAAVAAAALVAAAIFAAWRLLPPGASPGPIRSLAVLPLENLSGDPAQEYFADGMTETLIGDLGKIGALKVISRTSVMQYKGARKPLREIAAELGVDALLEGTVIREGDRVRVTAQLIDGRTDHHLWAERYDRELRGILELQSDVARAVAREVELELSPGESARLAHRRPVDPAAHDAFLKGLYHFGRYTPESVRSALESFERATELDPGYASAHAYLGLAWHQLADAFNAAPPLEAMPKAKATALRALELDAESAEAHSVLGAVSLFFDWDWPASTRHFQRALELSPSAPMLGYPVNLVTRGREDEAIAEGRRAVAVDPLSLPVRTSLAVALFLARRYNEALAESGKVLEMDSTYRRAHFDLASSLHALGRYEEGIGAFERAGTIGPEMASALHGALSREGPGGYYREWLRIAPDVPAMTHVGLALVYAQLGERDEAFAELERAYTSREGSLVYLRTYFWFDPIRDDPRFDELVRRVGIPES
jgi:TolB-like protein/class 3 adenylate cyclase